MVAVEFAGRGVDFSWVPIFEMNVLVSDRTTSVHKTELKTELKTRLKIKKWIKNQIKIIFNSFSYRIKNVYFGLIPD